MNSDELQQELNKLNSFIAEEKLDSDKRQVLMSKAQHIYTILYNNRTRPSRCTISGGKQSRNRNSRRRKSRNRKSRRNRRKSRR